MIHLDNLVGAIYQAVLNANDALAERNAKVLEDYFESCNDNNLTLRPRTVIMQYPQVTANGVEVHDVHVPLITLVPMSMTKISEVTFKAGLEVAIAEGGEQLHVGFPSLSEESLEEDGEIIAGKANASIEIKMSPTTTPDGLKKLIEGYEKALRAQIPG